MAFELKQVFAHSPEEFAIDAGMAWIPPCWIQLGLYLRPISEATRREFLLNLNLPLRLDAFSKTSHDKQFESEFWKLLDFVEPDEWYLALTKWRSRLKDQLRHLDKMFFPEPLRFVSRDMFVATDLATVLKESPERMEVYLAEEERTYTSYYFLRIHSSLWHFFPEAKHFWFEKRLPSELEAESILPWFMDTIRRLPKTLQPNNLEIWIERFLRSEPKLSPPSSGKKEPWLNKPKVILVFGATHKVGYRSWFSLERSKISSLKRNRELLTIVAKIQYGIRPDQALEWMFHLLTADESAAHRVEQEILRGEKVHFGLDLDIVGMIARTAGTVHSINVPLEKVRELCLKNGESLENALDPRNKHKVYYIVSKSASSVAK